MRLKKRDWRRQPLFFLNFTELLFYRQCRKDLFFEHLKIHHKLLLVTFTALKIDHNTSKFFNDCEDLWILQGSVYSLMPLADDGGSYTIWACQTHTCCDGRFLISLFRHRWDTREIRDSFGGTQGQEANFPRKSMRFDRGHRSDAKAGVASQKICDTFSATIERSGGYLDLCVPVEHLQDDMGGAPNAHHSTFQLLGVGFSKGDNLFECLKWRVTLYRDRKSHSS